MNFLLITGCNSQVIVSDTFWLTLIIINCNIGDYDIMINFYMHKKNNWCLSFYTAKDDIDVSKIAAKFGGGGHAKAAGASSLNELPEFLQKGQPWVSPKLLENKQD